MHTNAMIKYSYSHYCLIGQFLAVITLPYLTFGVRGMVEVGTG